LEDALVARDVERAVADPGRMRELDGLGGRGLSAGEHAEQRSGGERDREAKNFPHVTSSCSKSRLPGPRPYCALVWPEINPPRPEPTRRFARRLAPMDWLQRSSEIKPSVRKPP